MRLARFDEIFAVLADQDASKVQKIVAWARAEGKPVSPETEELVRAAAISDAEVERLITERQQARKARDFRRSDQIRDQLADAGIILEDTKDGVRWKRK